MHADIFFGIFETVLHLKNDFTNFKKFSHLFEGAGNYGTLLNLIGGEGVTIGMPQNMKVSTPGNRTVQAFLLAIHSLCCLARSSRLVSYSLFENRPVVDFRIGNGPPSSM